MTLTLMAVHAHPDDEVTQTGGVLAKAAAQGHRTVLVTCTDGRCGDGPGGVKPGDEGHDPEAVVTMRMAELGRSAAILDIGTVETLGYGDSGMMGWETNSAPGAFWGTPVAEAADRLAALMRTHRPDVVVTYDPNGFYGHPDHIQAHRITMAAVELLDEPPAKVYWTTAPRSQMEKFFTLIAELMAEAGEEMPEQNPDEEPPFEMGAPDEEVTTYVDTTSFAARKFEAMGAHASQGDNIMFLRLGVERFTEHMGIETFIRVRDTTGAPVPEQDLFDGLG
ncbi:PIG-L family deacetylase [Spongisporangium articulatum]|uniref:PIG-L family deacetylase n=1 Tax=Spongisporangium articulatum TaxID=3362603 RepID=A0ABW8ATZ1_9ACTN